MSNLVLSILCPNYEDYEPYRDSHSYLKHWPDMWPAEKYAEASLWREHQRMLGQTATWMRDNLHWCHLHTPKDKEARAKHRERMTRILASLARQQGWQVNTVTKDGTIIYKTS